MYPHHIRRNCCKSELCNEVNWKTVKKNNLKKNQRPENPENRIQRAAGFDGTHGRLYKVVSFASCCRARSAMSGFNPSGEFVTKFFVFFVAHWYA